MNHLALHDLLNAKEGENLEFKENKHRFDFEELVKYACAIANCGGGHIVYGVTDKRPRQVVGTTAIEQPERTRRGLMDRIGLPFDFQLFEEDGKQVVVFIIPPRPVGIRRYASDLRVDFPEQNFGKNFPDVVRVCRHNILSH